ncbi:MAG: hypothetical protein M1818_004615 [Claussenomyces sp. TS43310]|nr:MAG: hypothetical protein M1818_004615 [Claussenomyces sp. TS43310]
MSVSTPYKPSPLSFGSPRASPFRRPESPSSPSPLRNSTTPTTSPTKTMGTPSKLKSSSPATTNETWTPRGLPPAPREPSPSPTRGANETSGWGAMLSTTRPSGDLNALSKLHPRQVRDLRESFQILDRDSDGVVGREDVAEMLTQLGLPSTASDISPFFLPSHSQTLTLPTFLTSLSADLSSLSPPSELLSAFAAFDEDDSGQVDLAELRDALLHTTSEPGDVCLNEREIDRIVSDFSGRRAFGKTSRFGKRGEVFNYQAFVGAVAGGNGDNKDEKEEE